MVREYRTIYGGLVMVTYAFSSKEEGSGALFGGPKLPDMVRGRFVWVREGRAEVAEVGGGVA